jgi:hypothetical protein
MGYYGERSSGSSGNKSIKVERYLHDSPSSRCLLQERSERSLLLKLKIQGRSHGEKVEATVAALPNPPWPLCMVHRTVGCAILELGSLAATIWATIQVCISTMLFHLLAYCLAATECS